MTPPSPTVTEQLRRTSTGWEVTLRVADDRLETFTIIPLDEASALRRASRMASLAARLRRHGWSRASIIETLTIAGGTLRGDWRAFTNSIDELLEEPDRPERATTPPTRSVL